MSKIAIKVENVSKAYQLGNIGTGTISRDIERWWARVTGKEDPFLKIGELNDRTKKGNSDVIWSLKDINFEIEQGDAVGIIGRNGAGKSTLLKILSRVTAPTTGKISGNGRIASLLEVGTGFHPELSGRENIYLNGAILGMRKREIARKFDEIVDFSGVERYIDTPVKRYSSGMYVRLAFAVAAHLESEILIVDEVLAVGDAEFQKKCLGKMGEVSKGEGRTVLFVSHSMQSIRRFCKKGILLQKGEMIGCDTIDGIVSLYEKSLRLQSGQLIHREGDRKIEFMGVSLISHTEPVFRVGDKAQFSFSLSLKDISGLRQAEFFLIVYNGSGDPVSGFFQEDVNLRVDARDLKDNIHLTMNVNLPQGDYFLSVGIFDQDRCFVDWVENILDFEVEGFYSDGRPFNPRLGATIADAQWRI